jgi:hypothetical protein
MKILGLFHAPSSSVLNQVQKVPPHHALVSLKELCNLDCGQ